MPTKSSPSNKLLVAVTVIERKIYLIRGQKVMIDADLAQLYGVPTYRLNEAVKRNRKRFPSDFMFQLSKKQAESLTSQFAISKKGRGGRRTLPYAFTEQGVAMLSSVLNSERAIQVNIVIMRAFVKRGRCWNQTRNSPASSGPSFGSLPCTTNISLLCLTSLRSSRPNQLHHGGRSASRPKTIRNDGAIAMATTT
jgi:hypothetical protein